MNEQQMRERFQELLPWLVNGTLEKSQRDWMDQYLKEHPEQRAELRWYESLQSKIRENAPAVSEEVGLGKFLARIHQERRAKAPSLMQRINEFFAGFGLTPAFATAAAVILVQAGVIGTLVLEQAKQEPPDYAATRNIAAGQQVSGPVLQVSFKDDATERDIRMLLISVNGSVVGGPGQLGNYIVSVPTEKVDEAAAKLKASSAVELVTVLANLPAKE